MGDTGGTKMGPPLGDGETTPVKAAAAGGYPGDPGEHGEVPTISNIESCVVSPVPVGPIAQPPQVSTSTRSHFCFFSFGASCDRK